MIDYTYQQKATAPDGTKLKAIPEQPIQGNVCGGCYFEEKECINLRVDQPIFECSQNERKDGRGVIWIVDETSSHSSTNNKQIYKTPFYHKDGFIFDANHNCLMTDGQICRTIDKVGLTGYNRPNDECINKAADKITQAIVDALNQSYKE